MLTKQFLKKAYRDKFTNEEMNDLKYDWKIGQWAGILFLLKKKEINKWDFLKKLRRFKFKKTKLEFRKMKTSIKIKEKCNHNGTPQKEMCKKCKEKIGKELSKRFGVEIIIK